MGWPLAKQIDKTLLPFAASAPDTSVFFTDEIEKAAVFCITELNREKGGGFLRKQPAEKLVFISKVYYPFWLAPLREETLLLDGLNLSSHTITYPALPDLKEFKEDLKDGSVSRQVHVNFLSNNQNYFQTTGEQKLVVEGHIKEGDFIEEFLSYVKEGKTTDTPVTDSVLITPALSASEVGKMLQAVDDTREKMLEDIANLNKIIKLLNLRTQNSLDSLRKEIKETENQFSEQIQKAKAALDIKLDEIDKEYSEEVTQVSDKFEDEITALQKEIVKLEKTREQLNSEIEHVEAEIKTAAVNKDDSAEQSWKEKRGELKKQLPEIADKIKELQGQVAEIEENRKNELFKLKQNNDARIKEASKDLVEIEASRDAEVKTCTGEMEKIEELTANIIQKVDELAKGREAVILEFDGLGVAEKREEATLVYMPFYLSCFQSKSGKRCIYLAPSMLSDGGIGTRLKSVGKAKVTQMFQPRSRKIISILNRFIQLLDENIVFNREISEACAKANQLRMPASQEAIKNGLNTLKGQDWLSDREFESFSQAATQLLR